ncbi:MAG: 3-deoxy-D-manno-octulosonic acid transferase [Limnobacter sp.]|nr:3-deoxy-D-manno-octulosonic acid transferase [Limnobacter sp.]
MNLNGLLDGLNGLVKTGAWPFRSARLLYTMLVVLLLPVFVGHLLARSRRQPDYLKGWAQRFLAQVPKGYRGMAATRRVWVHAVSVGENNAVLPLVKAWADKNPEDVWAFSCTTPTGLEAAKRQFSGLKGVLFFYLPYDLPWLMHRCLTRVQANQLWLVETELWPNLLHVAQRMELPVALVNARVSPNTAKRLAQFRLLSEPAVGGLRALVAQTDSDASVFAALGRPPEAVCGNLKFDVPHRPELAALGLQWRKAWGARPVLLLASSREGEEALFLDALVRAQFFKRLPQASVWVVPRHPQRCDAVFEAMSVASARLGVPLPVRRSQFADYSEAGSETAASLVLGDSMGEMPAYYTVASVAFLGGSWAEFGGQNLIEACAYGCPVWMGPHTYNFAKAAEDAIEAGGGKRFKSLAEATAAFLECHGDLGPQATELARAYAAKHAGATAATLQVLERVVAGKL